ncbi:hypothetical protein HID58_044666 [Brassica napus]|uniref:Disease resistance protein Roq1-like winged-helix domain-containing protein n=1 Tax=Brassica napus TaxID=3708 RepID=A0ABQ8BKF9_BRANA|nr:hypothetical protein HID58_044666 [Brassica napus]
MDLYLILVIIATLLCSRIFSFVYGKDNEAKMIEDVATDVAKKLFNSTPSRDFDEFTGMEAHMNKISLVLGTDLDEVRMIGIWGPAGIGKTTIARCLFNQLSHTFQYSVFMMNVKAMCTPPVCSDDYNVKLHLQQIILMFGYNALSQENKDLFLHIACFFNYVMIEKVAEHLSTRFSNMRQRLDVLADKSLISLESVYVDMHDLLVQLGRDIVRKQSSEPGQRQFLVDEREICEVLADDAAGSTSVIGITFYRDEIYMSERAFEGMSNLQFLRFRVERDGEGDTFHLFGGASYLSRKLRLLDWSYFPMTCLHCIPNPELLVELIMRESKLENLWKGTKPLSNLKWVNLSESKNLKDVSSLSTATSLQELDLRGCSSLVELPSSIGNAIHLNKLDLARCSSLVELPYSIGNAIHLEKLNLSECSSLVGVPSSIGNATNLTDLDFKVPSSIRLWPHLDELRLSYDENLKEFPHVLDIMTDLVMSNTEIQEIPPWIKRSSRLRRLVLNGWKELLSLPQLPSSLSVIEAFTFISDMEGLHLADEVKAGKGETVHVHHGIKQNSLDVPCSPSYHILLPPLTEHLYIFEFEADVTSDELFFEFGVNREEWMIKECGVHYLNTR